MKTRSQDRNDADGVARPSSAAALAKSKPKPKSLSSNNNDISKKLRKKKTKGGTSPTALDPKKPKKPPTAFFYYLEDFRKTFQVEHPDVKSMRDIGKACGEKWKTMNFEEKVQYYDIATEKRAEYEKALAAYMKKKESGELSEEETEDEYE